MYYLCTGLRSPVSSLVHIYVRTNIKMQGYVREPVVLANGKNGGGSRGVIQNSTKKGYDSNLVGKCFRRLRIMQGKSWAA